MAKESSEWEFLKKKSVDHNRKRIENLSKANAVKEKTTMDAEEVLQSLGRYGRYQIITYLLLGFSYLRGAWHVFSIMFIGADPGHQCALTNDSSVNQSVPVMYNDGHCKVLVEERGINMSESCPHGYSYGSLFDSTILSEWDLVCDKDYMVDLSTTIYMIGNSLGAVLITPFSDRYGRKWVLLISLWIQGLIGIALAFVNSYPLFVCLRFCIGCLNMAIALITYVMITELFSAKCRTRPSIGASLFWSSGLMLLALFGYLVRDWRHLELLISAPNFITLAFIWLLPESVPWLVSQRKYGRLKTAISYAERLNKVTVPESLYCQEDSTHQEIDETPALYDTEVIDSQEKMVKSTQTEDMPQKFSALDLFKTPKLRQYTLIMFYLWFINSLGYFGILFSTPTLSGDMFVNLVLSGAVEIPACFICMFAVERVGRRKPLVIFLLICGVMNIITVFIPEKTASGQNLGPLIITFAMIGKFGITGSYSTIYLYSSEIFPTVVRNQAVGLSSFFENIGGIAAPFIVYGAKNLKQMPLVLFGILTMIGGILSVALPETHNRPLPDRIEDIEHNKEEKHRSQAEIHQEDRL